MKEAADKDGRLRDMFNFYGAHTGRWTAVKVQLQNLPKNQLGHLDAARQAVMDGESPEQSPFGLVLRQRCCLSCCVPHLFPQRDASFYVADYAAIEARVLAWLSNEEWRLLAFANGEDIYCSSASQMFGGPVEKNGRNAQLRQRRQNCRAGTWIRRKCWSFEKYGALQLGLKECGTA